MQPLILWMKTLMPTQTGSSLCYSRAPATAEPHVPYDEATVKWARVTTATQPQHRCYKFGFCIITCLKTRSVYNGCTEKLIKAKGGLGEDDPTQQETQTCPTVQLKQKEKKKSPVFV